VSDNLASSARTYSDWRSVHNTCVTAYLTVLHIFNLNLGLFSILNGQYETFTHYSFLIEDWGKQQVAHCLKTMDTFSRLGRFTPGTSWIGSCVDLMIGLDALKTRKISNRYRDSKEKSTNRESFHVSRNNGSETSHLAENQNITSVECLIALLRTGVFHVCSGLNHRS
jgi:hypothetical protein